VSELVVPAFLQPGNPEGIKVQMQVAKRIIGLLKHYIPDFVERCQELREHKAWEIAFTDEPKTWERLCQEAFYLEPGFVAKLEEAATLLAQTEESAP
jgi:hypothetical protein